MESFGKNSYCEKIEAVVLDLDRSDAIDASERNELLEHVTHCPRCAALQDSWRAAKEDLLALAEVSAGASAPARVEMRLRQEFRSRHGKAFLRRTAGFAASALAASAALAAAVSLWNWEKVRHVGGSISNLVARTTTRESVPAARPSPAGDSATPQKPSDEVLTAQSFGDDSGDFTPLPGSTWNEDEEGAILRVSMPRSSLGALGFPVNEQRATEWIQVDLLVGSDGLPQAVRLPSEEN